MYTILPYSLVRKHEVLIKPHSKAFIIYLGFLSFLMGGMDWANNTNREQLSEMGNPRHKQQQLEDADNEFQKLAGGIKGGWPRL